MIPNISSSRIDLSVVIPILNEQESISELHNRLLDVLKNVDLTYEIVFVDDGSSDNSVAICRELTEIDEHVILVELRRNFGKATALQAGFQLARGELIITMDGDLQDDPYEIPRFLEALDDGLDLVSGWKKERQDPLRKTLPSRLFNWVTSLVSGISLRDFNCGFKAYRREVVERINLYGELHRYIPVLAHSNGFLLGEIPVRHHPRRFGKSKYNFQRFFRGAFDLFTVIFLSRFQRRPLHLFGLLGLLFAITGFGIDLYLTILWFLGRRPIGNRPLLTLGTLLIILGIQVLVFGLLGEMITAATYQQSGVVDLVRKVHRHPTAKSTMDLVHSTDRKHA